MQEVSGTQGLMCPAWLWHSVLIVSLLIFYLLAFFSFPSFYFPYFVFFCCQTSENKL
jgi:hypothetical protein